MKFDEIVKKHLHLVYETRGEVRATLDEYRQFLDNTVKFREEGDFIVVEEKTPLIDVPEEAIKFLLENPWQKIDGGWLRQQFRSSKHWRNLKNVQFGEIWFGLFDFSDDRDIDRFDYGCFGEDIEDLQLAREMFREHVGGDAGFYGEFQGIHIICVNSRAADIHQVLHHELSHLVQSLGKTRIVDGVKPEDIKKQDLLQSEFGIGYSQLVKFFSGREFIPHVDDLAADLKKLRAKHYGSLSGLQFKKEVLSFLSAKTMKDVEESEFWQNFSEMNGRDAGSLMMLLSSKISGYKFQKILDCMRDVFS